jgi:hypothetical protein
MPYDAPSKYQGTGTYGALTDAEQTSWGEYTNLRGISDWPGFDVAQDGRRADSRAWLLERTDYIVALATGEIPDQDPGWETAHRGQRYDYLQGLNSGSPKHEVRLPCPGSATDTEKVYTEEREAYLAWASAYDAQKARKQANVDWLVGRRKQLWHLMADDPAGNEPNDRQARYDALCVATHHGSAYEQWEATHNKYGEPYTPDGDGGRSACKRWLESFLGVHESPDGSNCGSPQPSTWQERVIGYDGVPWCAALRSARRGTAASPAPGRRACGTTPNSPRRAKGSTRGTRPTRPRSAPAITPSSPPTTPGLSMTRRR